MIIKDFTSYFKIKILYESESAHTPNYNQELTDTFIYKMVALKTKCQQNIHYV